MVFLGEGASVNLEGLQVWFDETLPTILENYELKDIWNCDELGLFYRQLPNKTLVNMSRPLPKSRKLRKERVTVLLCEKATGERFMPLVIGPSKNPRAFVQNGVRNGKTEGFGFAYRNQAKAWMTQQIFNDYLTKLNDKMAKDNRNIAMILDNFQGHKVGEFTNLRLYFLAPNTTSHAQPFDGGIIKNFRDFFRLEMGADLLNRLPSCQSADDYFKGINLWEAASWTVKADESVTVQTRVNCFRHCRVCQDPVPILDGLIDVDEPDQHDWSVIFDEEDDPFDMDG